MAIYKPVSTAARAALGIGGSILNGAAGALGQHLGGKLGDSFGGRLGNAVLQNGLNLATGEITRRVANPTLDVAQKADTRLKQLARKGLGTFGLNAFDDEAIGRDAMHHAGNLSVRDLWEIYRRTDSDELSRKNFYVLEVNDRSNNAPTSGGHRHSQFNLLTTALSFTSMDIQGEAVPIGAAELDKPNSNARTVMTLTVMDDRFGTIKRWAEQKAYTCAATDGTFMPPAYYVFDVRVVFGTNIADERYYEQIYTMRMQTMPHELARTEQGLEEIQLVFAQTDTCMPHWL